MSIIPLIFTIVIFLIPGIIGITIGVLYYKKQNAIERVEIAAVVVEFRNWLNPYRVVFDYPLPDGTWSRQVKIASHMTMGGTPGEVSVSRLFVQPGHIFPVYVNQADPLDVSLGVRSATAVLPIVSLIIGGGATLMFLLSNAMFYLN